ncbi:CrcB family protein [Flavobacterium oreochromis]|uniref:CrcB family protein n=1 Tax=Flavobacterium oreochromis TaxID=2906078 RepID=UPI002869CB7D|nr:CrcB family protein [Flavobacterium oreochromis]
MKSILYIGLGGGIGSILRYLASLFLNRFITNGFPIGTFIINSIGCLLIGLFWAILKNNRMTRVNSGIF